ncbi:hypothetical protein [Limnohabitans sp. T6-20]|uniref:hypothetical protein n=1 Tax=Limnohabitans sp. T6-20 TaxID=1100725 RepID=UPI001E408BA9|nr:hypothetical protein [Limnohabitans sp. T6-20]
MPPELHPDASPKQLEWCFAHAEAKNPHWGWLALDEVTPWENTRAIAQKWDLATLSWQQLLVIHATMVPKSNDRKKSAV